MRILLGRRGFAVAVGVAAVVTASVSVAVAPAAPRRSAADNRRAAKRDASALLHRIVLPASAVATGSEPSGDQGLLAQRPNSPETTALIDRHAFWLDSLPLDTVRRFFDSHVPAGSRLGGEGFSGGPGIPPNHSLMFAFSALPAGIGSRSLVVNLVALPGERTGVRVDAQVVWLVPRAASERVPDGVHEIDISRGVPGDRPTVSVTVTAPAAINAIVAAIDGLPIVQPGTLSCPIELVGKPVVQFVFRAAPGGAVLARASEDADVTEPTTPCDALSFSVRGRAQPSLLHGASFLRRVDRLTGAKLSLAPPPAG